MPKAYKSFRSSQNCLNRMALSLKKVEKLKLRLSKIKKKLTLFSQGQSTIITYSS